MTQFHLGIFDIKFWPEELLATDQFNKQFIDKIGTGKKKEYKMERNHEKQKLLQFKGFDLQWLLCA